MTTEIPEQEEMTLTKINDLRAQVVAGEDVSNEQLASALAFLREGRKAAATVSKPTRRKASGTTKTEPINLESLFATKVEGE